MLRQDMKGLFSVATCASVLTSLMLLLMMYVTPHPLSSMTCVNYSPQYQLSNVRNNYNQSQLVNRLLLSSGTISTADETSTMSTPNTNVELNYEHGPTAYPDVLNVSYTNTMSNSISESRIYKESYFHEEVNFQRIKSWSKGVLTEMRPSIRQNCSKLILGDQQEINRTQLLLQKLDFEPTFNYTTCSQIRTDFSDNFYVSDIEKRFPLAYVLVVHTNPQQILRFLKTIYRPHNRFCIHPDPHSAKLVEVFQRLSECLPNIFIASRVHHVKYTRPSTIFRAQMSCFGDLDGAKERSNWKYVVNLCGRELPLKTNRQIVEALMKMNGRSVIKPHPIDQYTLDTCFSRARSRVAKNASCIGGGDQVGIAAVENCDPFLRASGLRLFKSMTYNAYSREFVRYFMRDSRARALQDWLLRNCRTPEEHYYAMAAIIPGAPGGNSSWDSNSTSYNKTLDETAVFRTIWYHYKSSPHHVEGETCAGKVVHSICILNTAELPRIYETMTSTGVWFFNKFFMEEDHVIMDCMEEELVRRNREEYENDRLLGLVK